MEVLWPRLRNDGPEFPLRPERSDSKVEVRVRQIVITGNVDPELRVAVRVDTGLQDGIFAVGSRLVRDDKFPGTRERRFGEKREGLIACRSRIGVDPGEIDAVTCLEADDGIAVR